MNLHDFIQKYFGLSPEFQYKLIESAVIIFIIFIIRNLVRRLLISRIEDIKQRYQWLKTLSYISVFIILFFLIHVWFRLFDSFSTFLGLVSAGIAIALKDPLANIVAWLFIMVRKPFKVGDRIQIGKVSGDVIDIRLFQFSVNEIGNWVDADQSTGRIIHVPNGIVFTEPQANYTTGFEYIWNEMPVLLTFESNWQKAKEILLDIVNRHAVPLNAEAEQQIKETAIKFLIFYSKLTPIVYTSVKDSGVLLTIRYVCDPRKRRITEEQIWEKILTSFAEHKDIDFAYPTTRFYNNITEGKQKADKKSLPTEE